MKRALSVLLIMLIVMLAHTFISANAAVDIPGAVQTAAEANLSAVREQMSRAPKDWGFADESEIAKLTLGVGLLVRSATGQNLDKASSLTQLLDDRIAPFWIYPLVFNGLPRSMMKISTTDGGASYSLQGFGGGLTSRYISTALDRFNQLVLQKGAATRMDLVASTNRYIITATINDVVWALPVPNQFEAAQIETWQPERLWTEDEIIQAMKNSRDSAMAAQEVYFKSHPEIDRNDPAAMLLGAGIDFTKIPAVKTTAAASTAIPFYQLIIVLAIAVPIVILSIFLRHRIDRARSGFDASFSKRID